MRVQTWTQDRFLSPRRYLEKKAGDFWSIDEFLPALDGQSLQRAPGWTGHVDLVANFSVPVGAFYDESDDRFVFIGTSKEFPAPPFDADGYVGVMLVEHDTFAAGSLYTTGTNIRETLGGVHKQNAYNIFSSFWFIDADKDVFQADTPYSTSCTNRYNESDALAIVPVRDTMFLVTESDVVKYYDPDLEPTSPNDMFATYYDPERELNVKYVVHYREDIVLFAGHDDGSLMIYQLPARPPAVLRELVRMPHETGQYLPDTATAQYGTPFQVHDDRLYFSPGIYWSDDSDCEVTPIWIYDGNSVELVENVEAPIVPTAWGLTEWRGRLILYFLNASAQYLYVLHDGRFVQFNSSAYTLPSHADLYSIGGEIWMPTMDSGTEGWTRLDDCATAVFTSSWLDFGRPTVEKFLSHVAAVVSEHSSTLKVKIEYRTETGSWTTAVETTNARHVSAENLGVTSHLVQLRVTFTDDGGTNPSAQLHSLGATYSYGR